MPIREADVKAAVRFLSIPKVAARTEAEKKVALKRNGLQDEEIEEALRRYKAANPNSAPAAAAAPSAAAAPAATPSTASSPAKAAPGVPNGSNGAVAAAAPAAAKPAPGIDAVPPKSQPEGKSKPADTRTEKHRTEDDMPLQSMVAKPKKTFNDDMPLSLLASAQKAKPRASAKGKAGARKAGSSSSSSSDSSDSDDSSSSSAKKPGAKKRLAPKKSSKLAALKKKKKMEQEGGLEGQEIHAPLKKKERSVKEQVVADLLCRWWYVLPEWPPNDEEYYKAELKKLSLRKVSIQEWEWVPEKDANGFQKAYELSQFKGLFRNSAGDLIDLRPKDTMPSFNSFMSKDLPALYQMLSTAYENQLKDLDNSHYDETAFRRELKATLVKVQNKAHQAAQMAHTHKKV